MLKTHSHTIDDSVERLLIVSDIHSYLRPLHAFEAWRARLDEAYQIVFNGDMFHGGPSADKGL